MSKQRQKHRAVVTRDYYYCISRKFAHVFTYRHPHGWRELARMSRARRRENNGYRLVPPDEDGLDNWRFVKQERWGNLVTEMDGMYKEVMK